MSKINKAETLEKGKKVMEAGNNFYELLMDFHNGNGECTKELEELSKTDKNFKQLAEDMEELGHKLGM